MRDATPAELLAGVARGDDKAWEAIVERYAGLVWSVARSVASDPGAAADVSQTVWLRLAEHSQRIREPDRLASWLAITARHEAIRLSKAARRQSASDDLADRIDATASVPGERLEDRETLGEVRRAFLHLSAACQDLLRLLTAEPRLDYDTIAVLVDRPIGSIGPTRARCLDHLRRLLSDLHTMEQR